MNLAYDELKGKKSRELIQLLGNEIDKKGGRVSEKFLILLISQKLNEEQNKKIIFWTVFIGVMTLIMLIISIINICCTA